MLTVFVSSLLIIKIRPLDVVTNEHSTIVSLGALNAWKRTCTPHVDAGSLKEMEDYMIAEGSKRGITH